MVNAFLWLDTSALVAIVLTLQATDASPIFKEGNQYTA